MVAWGPVLPRGVNHTHYCVQIEVLKTVKFDMGFHLSRPQQSNIPRDQPHDSGNVKRSFIWKRPWILKVIFKIQDSKLIMVPHIAPFLNF